MTPRRDFLKLTLASGLGLLATPALARVTSAGAPTSISESFVFPAWREAVERVVASTANRGDLAFWRAFVDSGAALGGQAASGHALLTLPAPGVELFAPDAARALAASANDALAQTVRDSQGRIGGLATVSALDPNAAKEAERAIGKLGLSGITLAANRSVRLDDPRLTPLYAFAQSAGVPIYLPASYTPATRDAPYRALGAPGILAGAAAESADHARQLIFGGVLDAFPQVQVILSRLGEATPYWHTELVETFEVMNTSNAQRPRQSVDRYFADNILLTSADMESAETLGFCSAVLGGDRILHSPEQRASARVSAECVQGRLAATGAGSPHAFMRGVSA